MLQCGVWYLEKVTIGPGLYVWSPPPCLYSPASPAQPTTFTMFKTENIMMMIPDHLQLTCGPLMQTSPLSPADTGSPLSRSTTCGRSIVSFILSTLIETPSFVSLGEFSHRTRWRYPRLWKSQWRTTQSCPKPSQQLKILKNMFATSLNSAAGAFFRNSKMSDSPTGAAPTNTWVPVRVKNFQRKMIIYRSFIKLTSSFLKDAMIATATPHGLE